MPEWTFLTNHALALSYIARQPRVTARDLANVIGITERATRKIIADLLAAGYITKKREGRRNRYRIKPDLSLRHPSHQETAVGDLLQALGWKRRRRSPRAASSASGDACGKGKSELHDRTQTIREGSGMIHGDRPGFPEGGFVQAPATEVGEGLSVLHFP